MSGYMPPKLSTLAPKLKGSSASGLRPATTHATTSGGSKEPKAAKPYNATGSHASCLRHLVLFSKVISDNAKYVRNAVCDRLLAGPVLQREREDVLHRLAQGDYVQWVVLLTRDMPFKVRAFAFRPMPAYRLTGCSYEASTVCRLTVYWRLQWALAPQ